MSIHPPLAAQAKCSVLLAIAFLLSADSMQGATIVQDDNDYIAFETEIGDIDNSDGTQPPSANPGWIVDGVTTGPMPANPSGDSYVVNTDNDLGNAPNDTLAYEIDLLNDGGYTAYFRYAYTTQNYEGADDRANQNDSWYYQSGSDGASWTRMNGVGPSLTAWKWRAGGDDVTFSATGTVDWLVSSREDGAILDRIVLISEDNTNTISDTYLDSLDNSTVVPEPATAALLGLAGIALLRRRRS